MAGGVGRGAMGGRDVERAGLGRLGAACFWGGRVAALVEVAVGGGGEEERALGGDGAGFLVVVLRLGATGVGLFPDPLIGAGEGALGGGRAARQDARQVEPRALEG